MNIKQFILNNNIVLEEFAKELRDKIYLDSTLIPLTKLKFEFLSNRTKLPITKHDVQVAIEFLLRN